MTTHLTSDFKPRPEAGFAAEGPDRITTHARPAFTLIELVVAMSIVGLVVAAGSTLLWQVTEARARIEVRSAHHAEADAALHAVTDALRATFRNVGEEPPLFEGVDEELDGRPADQLRFRRVSERVIRADQPEWDVHEVEFWLEPGIDSPYPSLVRRTDPTFNEPPDGGGVVERVADNIAALEILYFDGETWTPDWPEFLGDWPVAVRVRVGVILDEEAGSVRWYQRLVHLPLMPEASGNTGDEGIGQPDSPSDSDSNNDGSSNSGGFGSFGGER